eukprot:750242_1
MGCDSRHGQIIKQNLATLTLEMTRILMSNNITNTNKCTLQFIALLTIISFLTFIIQDIDIIWPCLESQPILLMKPINTTLPLLSHDYTQCFYINHSAHYDYLHEQNHFTSRICTLPNDITITISQRISNGRAGTIYLTHINDKPYVMKYSHFFCDARQSEYNILKALDSTTKINVPSIHPSIPYYRYTLDDSYLYPETCFFFMEYLANASELGQFLPSQTPQSLNEIDRGVIGFILHCYDDIMNAIDRMYHQANVFHNDLSDRNILVDMNNHKCFLIDFEQIFYFPQDLYKIYKKRHRKQKRFKCKVWWCSATAKYLLATGEARQQMRTKYLQDGYTEDQIVDRFAEVAIYQMRYRLISLLLHHMLRNPNIIANQSADVEQLNGRILNASGDGAMAYQWCTRLTLLSSLDVEQLQMENDPFHKRRFSELVEVFEMDTKVMNVTCG